MRYPVTVPVFKNRAQRFDEMDAEAAQHEKISSSAQAVDKKKEIARLLRKLREETPDLSTVA